MRWPRLTSQAVRVAASSARGRLLGGTRHSSRVRPSIMADLRADGQLYEWGRRAAVTRPRISGDTAGRCDFAPGAGRALASPPDGNGRHASATSPRGSRLPTGLGEEQLSPSASTSPNLLGHMALDGSEFCLPLVRCRAASRQGMNGGEARAITEEEIQPSPAPLDEASLAALAPREISAASPSTAASRASIRGRYLATISIAAERDGRSASLHG